jgi:ATP-dependent RNA helicase DDX52/ROK1
VQQERKPPVSVSAVFDLLSYATSVRSNNSNSSSNSNSTSNKKAKKTAAELPSHSVSVEQRDDNDNAHSGELGTTGGDSEVPNLRALHHIRIQSAADADADANDVVTAHVPLPIASFESMATAFEWPAWLVRNLASFGFAAPTPIQMQTVPIMMGDQDLFAYSETGSGKTLAFLLPIFARLREPKRTGVRAVVLCPTRELAQQIFAVTLRLTKGTGWQTLLARKQTDNGTYVATAHKFDVLIATPFRLAKMVAKGFPLANVEHVVFDEADRLFDAGAGAGAEFVQLIDTILTACSNPARRCWLFSATRVETAEELARSVLHEPIRVVIGKENHALSTVKQRLVYTGDERGKLLGLWQLLRGGVSTPMLVFVQSTARAVDLAKELRIGAVRAAALHGNTPEAERADIISQFRVGELFVVVATDLLSRGIDYSAVKCVVNYDVPQTRTSYIHRVGRTGRAGRTGEAVTFCNKEDRPSMRIIASVMHESGSPVPDWIMTLPNPSLTTRKRIASKKIRRDPISKARIIQSFGADDDDDDADAGAGAGATGRKRKVAADNEDESDTDSNESD